MSDDHRAPPGGHGAPEHGTDSQRAVDLDRVLSDIAADAAPVRDVTSAKADPAAMFDELEAAITKHDRAPLSGLRELATTARIAIAAVATFVVVFGFGLTAQRHDLATYPAVRFAAEITLLTVALVATLVLSLRPLSLPTIRRPMMMSWVLLTLGIAVLIAIVPGVDASEAAPTPVSEFGPLLPRHWTAGLPCLSIGLAIGVVAYVIARLLDRGSRSSPWFSAAAAGVASNLALAMHCASGDVAHKLSSHASVGFVFLGCLGLAAAIESSISSARSGR
jgi:hypothetical protein